MILFLCFLIGNFLFRSLYKKGDLFILPSGEAMDSMGLSHPKIGHYEAT